MAYIRISVNDSNGKNNGAIENVTFYSASNPEQDSYIVHGTVYINIKNIQAIEVTSAHDNKSSFVSVLLQSGSYTITINNKYLKDFLKVLGTRY